MSTKPRSKTTPATSESPCTPEPSEDAIVIKKYANRRLYNTATSSYVTLDYLSQMVRDGDDFVVYDAKSGEDITRPVLTQIIFEEENKGDQNLLPINFLRQIIRFYGDSLQAALPRYLEVSMENFAREQERMRDYFLGAMGTNTALKPLEEMARQNVEIFDQMMKMFSPFGEATKAVNEAPQSSAAEPAESDSINEVKAELDALKKRLDELSRK